MGTIRLKCPTSSPFAPQPSGSSGRKCSCRRKPIRLNPSGRRPGFVSKTEVYDTCMFARMNLYTYERMRVWMGRWVDGRLDAASSLSAHGPARASLAAPLHMSGDEEDLPRGVRPHPGKALRKASRAFSTTCIAAGRARITPAIESLPSRDTASSTGFGPILAVPRVPGTGVGAQIG
jgi:hypothetical protein